MLDRPDVAQVRKKGFEEAARWVRENREMYARAVLNGFVVAAPETKAHHSKSAGSG